MLQEDLDQKIDNEVKDAPKKKNDKPRNRLLSSDSEESEEDFNQIFVKKDAKSSKKVNKQPRNRLLSSDSDCTFITPDKRTKDKSKSTDTLLKNVLGFAAQSSDNISESVASENSIDTLTDYENEDKNSVTSEHSIDTLTDYEAENETSPEKELIEAVNKIKLVPKSLRDIFDQVSYVPGGPIPRTVVTAIDAMYGLFNEYFDSKNNKLVRDWLKKKYDTDCTQQEYEKRKKMRSEDRKFRAQMLKGIKIDNETFSLERSSFVKMEECLTQLRKHYNPKIDAMNDLISIAEEDDFESDVEKLQAEKDVMELELEKWLSISKMEYLFRLGVLDLRDLQMPFCLPAAFFSQFKGIRFISGFEILDSETRIKEILEDVEHVDDSKIQKYVSKNQFWMEPTNFNQFSSECLISDNAKSTNAASTKNILEQLFMHLKDCEDPDAKSHDIKLTPYDIAAIIVNIFMQHYYDRPLSNASSTARELCPLNCELREKIALKNILRETKHARLFNNLSKDIDLSLIMT